ncbi:xanthine dehydrogenase [Beijerinckia mobilis]|uniref:xanthine dehydrogenase n=1 Tax=Beijerinckia mobilis TaxID=231434 RepID=UPI0006899C8E|nr:xanthine dehydrogenase [Beijerinckia mobilis]
MCSPSFTNRFFSDGPKSRRPLAIVLGTNEIASAVAVLLHRSSRAVILTHDPVIPVIRRGMAFHDALFGDFAWVNDLKAQRVDYLSEVRGALAARETVLVTTMGLTDLLILGSIDVIVDARMHKRSVKPDLRGFARQAVGLGPGYRIGENCDLAIETRPGRIGHLMDGSTEDQHPEPSLLGGVGRERFVYTQAGGRWHTPLDVGVRVYKGVVLGHLGREPVVAPLDGILRGLARDDTEMPANVKIVEIDPSGRACRWTGMDERPRSIAEAVMRGMRRMEAAGSTTPGLVPGFNFH